MRSSIRVHLGIVFLLTCCGYVAGATKADDNVAVIIGQGAPELERYAGEELCRYLRELFEVRARLTTSAEADDAAQNMFLIGSPPTNPLVAAKTFPKSNDQTIVLQATMFRDRRALIVGGGSPRATLWAVYDLVEHWGVRYLLHGDVLPPHQQFEMPTLNVAEEPLLRVRQWRVLNEHAMGPISWGIADYRPVIDQLAKLRFNRLLLYIWPGQPFLPLEHKGITQTSGTLFFGNHYPINDDMVGRSLFGNHREFWNPDLPERGGDPHALTEAAVKHVRALIAYAKQRGMECVMPASLTEFPREFQPLIEHTKPVAMKGTPTIGPGPDTDVDDAAVTDLARAVLRTTLQTYPDVDYIALDMPEWRAWVGQYQRAWDALDAKYGIARIRTLHDVLAETSRRKDYPGGAERASDEVKADIVALYFYDKLISEPEFRSSNKKFVMSTVAEELFPILAKVLPGGTETLNFVDYTPSRIVKRRDVLRAIPAKDIPSVLIYTLHDDNVGVLPQLATGSLAELTHDIEAQGWAGFSTRYWLIGDHDPCVTYLARAAWDANAIPRDIYRDQIAHVCGDPAVDDMLNVFRHVEAATQILEWHGLGLTFTTPGMMMKHWTNQPLNPELQKVTSQYQSALEAATRALAQSIAPGQAYVRYWIGRLQFGIDYMNALNAVRSGGAAEAAGDVIAATHHAQRALNCATSALTAYAAVARDRSDLGAIAVMNEYVIRPLRAKVALLQKAPPATAPTTAPTVRATDFRSTKVYQSKQRPSYTSWVSFFPGNKPDEWYIGCAELTRPGQPTTRATTQFVYEMSLPRGYDTSKFLQELVLLKSADSMSSWDVVSRTPTTTNGGAFGQACGADGTLHRFIWACYSRDPNTKTSDIYQLSRDGGKTWIPGPTFVSDRFAWYPQRLRTLRDGTLVLCAPRAAKWGSGTDYPIRAAMKLDVVSDMEMMLYFSHDQGKTWSDALPILSGQTVSETDFVELRDGNLLFINNSIFATPGRQFVYRDGNRFTPGPLQRVQSGTVPETVCLTEDGVLIGCHRPGTYWWSDDLGQNWHPLEGLPSTIEVYQPWIQYLGNGQVACAGHYGADDPIGGRDQSINLHRFTISTVRTVVAPKLWIQRGFDDQRNRFLNSFTVSLTAGGEPLAGKAIDVWYVSRGSSGYDSFNSKPLQDRMTLGGKRVTLRTDRDGNAMLNLPEFNGVDDIHASYQLVIRFNADRGDPGYASAALPQLEYYANSGIDP